MLKKKLLKISRSVIKIFLPLIFRILIKFKINRRVISYLQDKSYFGNQKYDFSGIIRKLLKSEKLIALDVGAQGGFNSDNFFSKKYNIFFEPILVEPINSEAKKLNDNKFVIDSALWSCLLYTSDAADEGLGVDLGGRRIIKKKRFKIWPKQKIRYPFKIIWG